MSVIQQIKPQPLFGTLTTIDGVDVIENATGRALDHRGTLAEANGVAFKLNTAAKAGPKALARALRSA